ncbi:MAG: EVE domain-containing protein, partial [Nitrosopumilus sp. B06]
MYWLAKQEPSGPRGYNFEQLKRDGKTVWDGVHNNLALKHMREMKPDDLVLYYHTGDERQAVGIMQVTSDPYPNPAEDNERFVVVDVKY